MIRSRRNRAETARQEAELSASALAHHLQHGGGLTAITVPDLPLAEGETAVADVVCWAERYYGTDLVVPSATGYFEQHPSYGKRWVPNHHLDARRLREAEQAAAPQWQDQTTARVVLTSTGLRLRPASDPAWLPFDHALLTDITVGQGEVVVSYRTCAPLRLAGIPAPWLGVAIKHLRGLVT
ncbi:hypothetical protein GTY78_23695 [Streptomyces sp. SID4934]|uniref:Uncharacterized protein n=1 Tax=Streptomyces wadayamensis TaxID=141454 RepID=A0ABR4S5M1_9ACTN|nr:MULTISPECIES: hypothetical protein [Streptomyces]MYQ74006.1 hypothetical protein [Streptomyces sp. SID4934]SCE34840.1 hypothetical protein GA0115237_1119124 [Streptomyces sp. ScaeMP-6W]KDR60943.1 hypothetical protein DC60_02875 [Streptomyces wadayamensis]QXQ25859.1 hypothetical protein STALF2_14600 [Streptomyces albidoflavus]QXQ31788.1 hypothetical protein STALF4_14650 [Streptomyces albidoflavus]